MANKRANADRALLMGLVHEVLSDETFQADFMHFCRHSAELNGEQMGAAKLAIEMCNDIGREEARNFERIANKRVDARP